MSLKDNARFHKKQNFLLKIDLKDYFTCLNESSVYKLFLQFGYSKKLCILMTKLCTLSHSLPQGAPTSPYLSNLLTINLDDDIAVYCRNINRKLRYSRYADDITISGESIDSSTISDITKLIKKNSLTVNTDKVHIFKKHQQQIVTGIVVNEKLQVSKKYRDLIRMKVYYINKFGLINHMNMQKIDTLKQKNIVKN